MLNKMKSAFGGNKLFTKILLGVFAVFLFAGSSYAATSVRLQQPKSPTGLDTFNVTFVALDTNPDQPVSVQCFKKAPSDGSFTAFGGVINLSNGGNTDVCQVTSGIVHDNGTYQFYVVATGEEAVQSNTVNVDFNNSTPGTPVNYNKEKPDNCTYKISFRTANDSGKTVKVVLYRSSDTSFSLDSGHQVNETNIGSDTDGSMTDNVSPNCDKTYYYVIRAFDTFGNGSGVVGDSNVTVTVSGTTVTTGGNGQGAIALGNGQGGGSVLGTETGGKKTKEVLGTESANPTKAPAENPSLNQNPITNSVSWAITHKKLSLLILIILAAVVYYLYRRFSKKV